MAPPLRLTVVCLFVSIFGQWQFGYRITYINTAVKIFYDTFDSLHEMDIPCFNCSPFEKAKDKYNTYILQSRSWDFYWGTLVASFYPGAILGFILVPFFVAKVGVKSCLLISTAPAVLGCIIGYFAKMAAETAANGYHMDEMFYLLVLSRILTGVHGGAALALLPLFITECSPLRYQGLLAAFQELAMAVTSLCGVVLGEPRLIDSDHHYELLQLFGAIPTLLFIVLLLFIPNTPVYEVVKRENTEKGEKSIKFYYGNEAPVEYVSMALMQEHGSQTQKFSAKEIFFPTSIEGALVRKGLLLGALAGISYAFTADDLLDSFSTMLFKDIQPEAQHRIPIFHKEKHQNLPVFVSVLLGFTLVVASVFGCFTIHNIGRRPTLVWGLVGTAVCNALVPFTQFIPDMYTIIVSVGLCVLCKACIGLGAGGPAWFLASELVPPGARSISQSISTGCLLLTTALVTMFFLTIEQWVGQFGLILLAAGPALVCAVLLYRLLPETKNKHFDEIKLELYTRKVCGCSRETLRLMPNDNDTGYGSVGWHTGSISDVDLGSESEV